MERLLRNVCFTRDDLWLSLLSAQGHYNLTKHFSNRMNLVKQSIFKGHHQYNNVKASMINCIHRFNIWNMWHLNRKYTGNLFLWFWLYFVLVLFVCLFYNIGKVLKVLFFFFFQIIPFTPQYKQHLEYWFSQLSWLKDYFGNVINTSQLKTNIYMHT